MSERSSCSKPARPCAKARSGCGWPIEASGTGLWEWNLQTESPELVAGVLRISTGWSKESLMAALESFFELIHPEDRARVRMTILAAVEDRNVYACDFRIVRPDEGVRWVTNKGRAFFDNDNQPLRMIGTIIDISYRKETELKLLDADRRKNEFLATLAPRTSQPAGPDPQCGANPAAQRTRSSRLAMGHRRDRPPGTANDPAGGRFAGGVSDHDGKAGGSQGTARTGDGRARSSRDQFSR